MPKWFVWHLREYPFGRKLSDMVITEVLAWISAWNEDLFNPADAAASLKSSTVSLSLLAGLL